MSGFLSGEAFAVDTKTSGTLTGLRWGSASDLPVLALHGWLDNASSFAPLASHLSGFQLLALDLPGHGHSQHRPPGMRYHLLDYVPAFLEQGTATGRTPSGAVVGFRMWRARRLMSSSGLGALMNEVCQRQGQGSS